MSQLSKVNQSRHQWKAKAKQRSDHNRSLRKQLARVKAERDQAKQDLKKPKPACASLRAKPGQAVRPQVEVVWLSLQLFRGPHALSRRLSRPGSAGLRARHQARTVSTNHHQLGHPPVDCAHRGSS